MSTLGKVFTVLNILVTLAFIYFATPVIKRYIDLQKDVQAIEFGGQDSTGLTHRSHEEIEKNAEQLDLDRVERQHTLGRIQDDVSLVRHEREQRVDELTKEKSFYQNLQESEAFLVKKWEEVVANLTKQVEKRQEEKQELEARLAELQATRNKRKELVDGLAARLSAAEQGLSETLATLQNNYEKLEKLVSGRIQAAGNIAASAEETRQ